MMARDTFFWAESAPYRLDIIPLNDWTGASRESISEPGGGLGKWGCCLQMKSRNCRYQKVCMWDKKFSPQFLKRGKDAIYIEVLQCAQTPVLPLQKHTVLKGGRKHMICVDWGFQWESMPSIMPADLLPYSQCCCSLCMFSMWGIRWAEKFLKKLRWEPIWPWILPILEWFNCHIQFFSSNWIF